MKKNYSFSLEWVLRIGVFGEFFGHGILAMQGKAQWVGWIQEMLYVDLLTATRFLFFIGLLDVCVATGVLLWKKIPRVFLLWAVIWGLWTDLLRPIMGEPIWDFIERWANWSTPLALLLLRGWPKQIKEWFLK